MLSGRGFKFADFHEFRDDALHHFSAFLDVRHLATAKQHSDLHFVFVLEETLRLFHLEFDIMVAGLRSQPDFFRFRVMSAPTLLLVLFVLVFAVVHDAANRGIFVGGDFDQIQLRILRLG